MDYYIVTNYDFVTIFAKKNSSMKKRENSVPDSCGKFILGIKDVQELMSGKWKYRILADLYYIGKMRFMELKRSVSDISPKVLSDEVKDLEMNQLVKRTVCDTKPITVEYELTELGKSFGVIIEAMGQWGVKYRELMFGNQKESV